MYSNTWTFYFPELENLNFCDSLGCKKQPRRPSYPYKPLSCQTLRHLQFLSKFQSPKVTVVEIRWSLFVERLADASAERLSTMSSPYMTWLCLRIFNEIKSFYYRITWHKYIVQECTWISSSAVETWFLHFYSITSLIVIDEQHISDELQVHLNHAFKVIHPKCYKHLKKVAQHSHFGR